MDKLIKAIINKKNPSVAGLDPRLNYLPESILNKYGCKDDESAAEGIFEFNKRIIDNLYDIVPAIKPQIACYEVYGSAGLRCYKRTVDYAKSKGLVVIGDIKRSDIGSTAEDYAKAHLGSGSLGADIVTINPYLGIDGVKPFIDAAGDGGIFCLVRTSNPSAVDFQDVICADGRKIFEVMADLVAGWGADTIGEYGYSNVGAVVGATYPKEGTILRKRLPNTFFLVPGYGAQGGGASDIKGCFDENGLGAVVNSSRGIMMAWSRNQKGKFTHEEFDLAARAEAIRMRDDIMNALGNVDY